MDANCTDLVEHRTGDYVKIGCLSLLLLFGVPINLGALVRLQQPEPTRPGRRKVRRRMMDLQLLKTHLNISDLMVMFLYGVSDLCWLCTYSWRAGIMLCKLVQFGRVLAFHISSNVVVCFAFNRLLHVCFMSHSLNKRKIAVRRVKIMLGVAWVLAVVSSSPQLLVWTTISELCGDNTWTQCCTVWDVQMHRAHPNSSAYARAETYSTYYNAAHLVAVFWLPTALILACYCMLVCRISSGGVVRRGPEATFSQAIETSTATETGSLSCMRPSSNNGSRRAMSVRFNLPEESEHPKLGRQNQFQRARTYTIRVSLMLTVAYVLCFMPYNVVQMLKILLGMEWYELSDIDNLTALVILNSLINPFLYGAYGCFRYYKHG